MSKKRSRDDAIDEYELMPIKPLRDLQREVRQLKKELKKEDSTEKLLVKLLNSNLSTQQRIIEQNYKLEEIKIHLNKFTELIKEIDTDDDYQKEIDKIHFKLDSLHGRHDDLSNVFKELKSQKVYSAFRRLPSGIPIRYKRKHAKYEK